MQKVQATITRRETVTITESIKLEIVPDEQTHSQNSGKEKSTVMPLIIIVLETKPQG